ncbi:putative E3 ubiquitin-protein ligase dtx2 [Borealophlyctis nickersoniae]|nr:putative E3 ubiquitin-protein ligase dtx2 [Borealophlyctis nickersoniae]
MSGPPVVSSLESTVASQFYEVCKALGDRSELSALDLAPENPFKHIQAFSAADANKDYLVRSISVLPNAKLWTRYNQSRADILARSAALHTPRAQGHEDTKAWGTVNASTTEAPSGYHSVVDFIQVGNEYVVYEEGQVLPVAAVFYEHAKPQKSGRSYYGAFVASKGTMAQQPSQVVSPGVYPAPKSGRSYYGAFVASKSTMAQQPSQVVSPGVYPAPSHYQPAYGSQLLGGQQGLNQNQFAAVPMNPPQQPSTPGLVGSIPVQPVQTNPTGSASTPQVQSHSASLTVQRGTSFGQIQIAPQPANVVAPPTPQSSNDVFVAVAVSLFPVFGCTKVMPHKGGWSCTFPNGLCLILSPPRFILHSGGGVMSGTIRPNGSCCINGMTYASCKDLFNAISQNQVPPAPNRKCCPPDPVLNICGSVYDKFEKALEALTQKRRPGSFSPSIFAVSMADKKFYPPAPPPYLAARPQPVPRVQRPLLTYLEHVLQMYNKGSVDEYLTPPFKKLLGSLDSFEGVFQALRSKDKLERKGGNAYDELTEDDRVKLKTDLVGDCSICLDELEGKGKQPAEAGMRPVKMRKCQHLYHATCVDFWLKVSPTCPYCKVSYLFLTTLMKSNFTLTFDLRLQLYKQRAAGPPTVGPMPAGYMAYKFLPDLGAYSILYEIKSSSSYAGTTRIAFVPFTEKNGNIILIRLIASFYYHHTFTVGTSLTSGRSNQTVWNGVHHRTALSGTWGFPDPTWEERVSNELDDKGMLSFLKEIMP